MSPEQLLSARQVDSRTDVWALGVIAFRMLAGRHPFDGETPAAVHIAIASNPAPRLRNQLPDLPLPIAWLVERCLVKSCNDRLQTASEFATVLLAYADEETQRRYAYLREGGPSLPAVAFSTVGNGSVRTRGRTARRRVQHVAVAGTIALIAASGLLLWSHHLATRLVGNPIAAGEMGSARPPAASENPAGESPVAPSPAPSFAPVVSTSAAATRSAPPTVRHDAKSMTHPKAQPVEPTARDPYAGRR